MNSEEFQGTSIEDIEMGNVKNEADSERMRQILADMNSTGDSHSSSGGNGGAAGGGHSPDEFQPKRPQPPPVYQQMPQFVPSPMMQPRMSVFETDGTPHVTEPTYTPIVKTTASRKNQWSSAIDMIQEPLMVAVIFLLLSLPKFHTWASERVSWAYAVGGQFSWYGLLVLSIVAGILFGAMKSGLNLLMH